MFVRAGFCLTAALVLLAPAVAAQRRPRVRDDLARMEGAAAVRLNFGAYVKKVQAPNGATIDLTPVLRRIAGGRTLQQAGFRTHDGDGSTFLNLVDRDAGRRPLPDKARGYYVEYVVPPNDGARWPGPQRLIVGRRGEVYYSPEHYAAASIVALHRDLK